MASRGENLYRRNSLPGSLFLIFTFAGILGIILTKLMALGIKDYFNMTPGVLGFLPTIAAVGMMILYFGLSVILPGAKTRFDQTGDNVYYMGFIFTLTSLSLTLSLRESADEIISSFGIAIFSTLAGIIGRTFLHQFRFDPDDVEAASRVELSEATRRVRGELDETILQLQDFRRTSIQTINEGFDEIRSNVEKLSNALGESITEMVVKANEPIQEISKQLTNSLEVLNKDMIEISKNLNKSATSQDLFVQKSELASEALKTFVQNLTETEKATQQLVVSMGKKIEDIDSEISKNFHEQDSKIRKVRSTVTDLKGDLNKKHKNANKRFWQIWKF